MEDDALCGSLPDGQISKDSPEVTNLVLLAREGDQNAFTELHKIYHSRLLAFIKTKIFNRGDADDLAEETFAGAFVKIGTFKFNSKFYTWLYRIAVNYVISFKRKKPIVGLLDDIGDWCEEEQADPHAEEVTAALYQQNTKAQIKQVMNELTEEHRSILGLQGFVWVN